MISIVATCHNRRVQLLNTLKSIDYFRGSIPIEVIVVDDTDEEGEEIGYMADLFDYPIYILPIKKDYTCSCVAYNYGFTRVTGSTVIIQNAECMHVCNILKYVNENARKGLYLTFGAYSVDRRMEEIKEFNEDTLIELRKKAYTGDTYPRLRSGWFNHSVFRPCKFHFCSAIQRTDLELISGFDERYKDGYAWDDIEILHRIENAGIETRIVDEPFVIHQWHPNGGMAASNPLWIKNKEMYDLTLKENLIKAPSNKVYVR